MDRDKRWERVTVGLNGIVKGEGEETDDPVAKIEERYEKKETDEFLKPIIVGGKERRIQGKSLIGLENQKSSILILSRRRYRFLLQLQIRPCA